MTGRHSFSKLRRELLASQIIKALRAGDRGAYIQDNGDDRFRIDGNFDLTKVIDSLVDRLDAPSLSKSIISAVDGAQKAGVMAVNETLDGLRIMKLENKPSLLRIQQLEHKSAQAYHVVGSLADATGTFKHPEVQKALDYFSGEGYEEKFTFEIEDQS